MSYGYPMHFVYAEILAAQEYVFGGYESIYIKSGLANSRNTEYMSKEISGLKRIRKDDEVPVFFKGRSVLPGTPALRYLQSAEVPVITVYPEVYPDDTGRRYRPIIQNLVGASPEGIIDATKNFILSHAIALSEYLDAKLFQQMYDTNTIYTQEAGNDALREFSELADDGARTRTRLVVDFNTPDLSPSAKFEQFWREIKYASLYSTVTHHVLSSPYSGEPLYFITAQPFYETILMYAMLAGVHIEMNDKNKRFFRIADIIFIGLRDLTINYTINTPEEYNALLLSPEALYFGFEDNSIETKSTSNEYQILIEEARKKISGEIVNTPYNVTVEALSGAHDTNPKDYIIDVTMTGAVVRDMPILIQPFFIDKTQIITPSTTSTI